MASYTDALRAKDLAFDTLTQVLHMRPIGAGLVEAADGSYSLKVVLPENPGCLPPATVNSVPVEYHVAGTRPELLSSTPSSWRSKSLKRRSGI